LATNLLDSFQGIFLARRAIDKRVWVLEPFGKFTSKSFFIALSHPHHPEPSFPHKKIWKPEVPPKIKAFFWIIVLSRINTMDMLQRRKPFIALSPQWCYLCHKDEESVDHIFFHCSFTTKVWTYFISRIGCYWVMPGKLIHMFLSWKSIGVTIRSTKFGDSLLHSILWGI